MAKITAEKIIDSLQSLDENELMEIAKAVAQEAGKREEALTVEIKEKENRLLTIRNGAK